MQYDYRHENGADIPLKLTIARTGASDEGAPNTDVQCETEGFEIVSHESLDTGEYYILKLSPGLPQGRVAVITLNIMDGDEVYITLYLYAVATEIGTYAYEGGTWTLWSNYYHDLKKDREFTEYEWDLIVSALQGAPNPSFEDPVRKDPRTAYLFE